MRRLVLPTFKDGAPADTTADTLSQNFFSQSNDSLAVINGGLGHDFINDLTELTYQHVQTPAFSSGRQVGGTASLDYFSGGGDIEPGSGWFAGVGEEPASTPNRWLAVPGANQRIYLPYEAYVLVVWSVTWANDSQFSTNQSHIGFFINNEAAYSQPFYSDDATRYKNNPCIRRIRRSQFGRNSASGETGGAANADRIQDRYKTRVYSGHYFSPEALQPGFHDIGLQICCSAGSTSTLKQTRVRARSLKYIYFRKGATF